MLRLERQAEEALTTAPSGALLRQKNTPRKIAPIAIIHPADQKAMLLGDLVKKAEDFKAHDPLAAVKEILDKIAKVNFWEHILIRKCL